VAIQCHVSLLDVKSLNVVPVFVILSQFGLNFVKTESISSCIKFKFYINFTMVSVQNIHLNTFNFVKNINYNKNTIVKFI